MSLATPYLLFLGDAPDALAAKVAQGICDWRPENCVGQLRLPDCNADCRLTDMSVAEARAAGARTVVVGVANRGGVISEPWIEVLLEALEAGMDVAAGLHNRLNDVPALRFLQEGNAQATAAKIALPRAVAVVIANGLGILGVTPVEEMR